MSDTNIKSFVVFDLETNGLPSHQFNKCSITEISLYGFSVNNVYDTKKILKDVEAGVEELVERPPELPRCLHKLTMMVNPLRAIHPDAEKVTGLSNEMLEHESSFDKNTAECLNNFLNRLERPICLVAHNGKGFDFPILRYVYDRIEMSLPSSVYCVDSLNIFREIDEKRENLKQEEKAETKIENQENLSEFSVISDSLEIKIENQENLSEFSITSDPLEENALINWQANNETTPKVINKTCKRSHDESTSGDSNSSIVLKENLSKKFKARRSLFSDDFQPKNKFPKKGEYKLGTIYQRCFAEEPKNLHRAESDVEILTKLILHYGMDFLACAEERKELFSSIPKLGTRIH
ncbi:hypothetical protein DOY81_005290 [Sarcophaga bullata]|nr:hypothetical protein DOY81_005290 [Sarcophaga bullata]